MIRLISDQNYVLENIQAPVNCLSINEVLVDGVNRAAIYFEFESEAISLDQWNVIVKASEAINE
jgi:hypothetical protein